MKELTNWVINSAFQYLAEWQQKHSDLRVSINISAVDLDDKTFPRRLIELAQQHGVRPAQVEVEITEGAMARDFDVSFRQIEFVRAFGFSVAIDDFGTGHSALAQLKLIPADILKIDQAFIRRLDVDCEDRFLVKTIIQLARQFGKRVVAEGVETEAIREILVELGCDVAQGYLFAKPLAAGSFITWRDKWNSAPGTRAVLPSAKRDWPYVG